MVAVTPSERVKPALPGLPVPLAGAGAGGGLIALVFLIVPAAWLERAVVASGIPAVLAAAEPPLGLTARIALGLGFGGLVAAFAGFGLTLLAGNRALDLGKLAAGLRRKPAAPEAAPRPPLFANRDLGTPFLDVRAPAETAPPAEQALPADLDQPLAAFDPAALLAVPLPAATPLAPLARPQLIDPGDRFETFELTPMQRLPELPSAPARPLSLRVSPAHSLRATSLREEAPAPPRPAPVVAPETESTVHALLARLERGVAGRTAPPAAAGPAIRAGSVEDTLGDLRRMAAGTR